ncbi:hypothetical protein BDW02DRAFT_570049 [Decorospora gaudefroyi]|uniref:Uncharacterized protein n=1 Tax=Decorospora gaudefroyi TaxID=184978 RepID=A0A6A5K6L3_9PLEO|nr:hypothetical protein BDW02DRAFT_570049 [Decorospora gaudefroyi]
MEPASSSRSVSSRGALRHRTGVSWVAPVNTPSISTSTSNEASIKNLSLLAIARTLMLLDQQVLHIADSVYKLISTGRLNPDDEQAQASAREDAAVIRAVNEHFNEIQLGRATFHEGYLQERILVTYWQKSFHLARQIIPLEIEDAAANGIKPSGATKQIGRVEEGAAALSTQLLRAASQGSLTHDMILSIAERWTRLEEILSFREREGGPEKVLESWDKLSETLEKQLRPSPLPPKRIYGSEFWSSTAILWSTFMVTTVAAVPLFAMGTRYSEHHAGTIEDADFYFLIQANLVQVLGIVLSYIPVWKSGQVPKRVGIPLTVLGIFLTILAIPVFLHLPKEWSNFLTMIGAFIQAFMVLQVVISST